MKVFKKPWIHILIWSIVLTYFVLAPDLVTSLFVKNGKPLQRDNSIPSESDRITFVAGGLESFFDSGEKLYDLYGWAIMTPEQGIPEESYVREITLISDDSIYFFPVKSVYRNPDPQHDLADLSIDLETAGFSALIAQDVIKPGKYRIGIVFRNTETGLSYYWDKPALYIIRTPNTMSITK